MTKKMNLIPAPRLAARQQRIWRGRGVVTCVAYAAIVAAVTLAARTVIGRSSEDMPGMLEAAQAEIDRTNSALSKVRTNLDNTESLLKSSRAIAEQPDWSLLLGLLAHRGNEEVVLKAVAVRPKDPPPAVAAPPKPGAKGGKPAGPPPEPVILVSITGAAKSQETASKFALGLESTGLFSKVSLLETTRETVADLSLVSFRLECTVAGAADKPLVADKAPAANKPAIKRTVTAGGSDLRKPAASEDEQ
jgi:hypothetical protein